MSKLKLYISISLLFPFIEIHAQDFVYKHGTTILALKWNDTLWVAADSKATFNNKPSINHCKFSRVGDTYYLLAGLVSWKDVSYDGYKLAKQLIQRHKGNIDKVFNGFIDSCSHILAPLCRHSRQEPHIDDFINHGLTTLIIIQKGVKGPVLKDCQLQIKADVDDCKIIAKTIESLDVDNDLLMIGRIDNVQNILNNAPDSIRKFPKIKDQLIYLISKQAENDSTVGMPVDVLMLYHNRYKRYFNTYPR